jgi:hypothetical protein
VIRVGVVLLLVPCMLAAQTSSGTPAKGRSRQMDFTGAMSEPQVYTPPTAADRWRYLYSSAFSPAAFGSDMASAAYSHVTDSVPEWGHRSV